MFTKNVDSRIKITILTGLILVGATFLSGYFGFHNRVTDVGYRPTQPVPFSHKLHAGDLEISCQYCHTGVEVSAHSPVPPTSTCMNCHSVVKNESPNLELVRSSWETGTPIKWRRVHKVPDYVRFDHSRHIRAEIDCASCHGKVEEMGVVTQMKPLNMGWCLDCHRNPEAHIIPAREISGIFTGTDGVGGAFTTEDGSIYPGDGRWNKMNENGIEAVALPAKDMPQQVAGIPVPRKHSLGPENCSACHY